MRRLIAIFILVFLVSNSILEHAMAFTKKLYLFSEVNGLVLSKGQPIPNVEVERIYNWGWKDITKQETVMTDQEGRFHFDSISESSFFGSIVPHEPVITQKILIHYQGEDYKAWMYTKHNYEENGELNGKPIRLACDLNSEPSFKDEVFGICVIEK
ncbi:MAG: DUF6795 domain-containing protein [Candidatus Competibacteraceae bacterium]